MISAKSWKRKKIESSQEDFLSDNNIHVSLFDGQADRNINKH